MPGVSQKGGKERSKEGRREEKMRVCESSVSTPAYFCAAGKSHQGRESKR